MGSSDTDFGEYSDSYAYRILLRLCRAMNGNHDTYPLGIDGDTVGRVEDYLAQCGLIEDGFATEAGLELLWELPVRFEKSCRLDGGVYVSATKVTSPAAGSILESLIEKTDCILVEMSGTGPHVSGTLDGEIRDKAIWLAGFSDLREGEILVVCASDDQADSVNGSIRDALMLSQV